MLIIQLVILSMFTTSSTGAMYVVADLCDEQLRFMKLKFARVMVNNMFCVMPCWARMTFRNVYPHCCWGAFSYILILEHIVGLYGVIFFE